MQCRKILMDNYDKIPFQQLKKKRHTQCQNTHSLGGYDISQFDQVLRVSQNKKTYCLVPQQYKFAAKHINPYTGKVIKHIQHTPEDPQIPLSQRVRPDQCPLSVRNKRASFVIIESIDPIHNISEPIPIVERNTNQLFLNVKTPRAIMYFDPFKIYSKSYVIAELKAPLQANDKVVLPSQIHKLYPLYHRARVSQKIVPPKLTEKVQQELRDFFCYRRKTFTKSVLHVLQTSPFRLTTNVKVYRGLFFPNAKTLNHYQYTGIRKGELLHIEGQHRPMSWTTDPCVAQFFATHEAAMSHSGKTNIRFGILLSTVVKPAQILLDTRLFDSDFFSKLYLRNQEEIISHPTVTTFSCRVERLYIIDHLQKATVVKSFQNFV